MKNINIKILSIILIAIGIAVFISLSQNNNSLSEQPIIKIGVILPLTGGLANVGEEIQIALSIAEKDLQEKYTDVEIIYEDDSFDPKKSVNAFNKLAKIDNVDFIIGPLNGSSIEAVRPLAQEERVVTFTPWGAGNNIADFSFKNSVEADSESKAILEYASNELEMDTMAILYLNNEWGVSHFESFRDNSSEFNIQLVASDTLNIGDSDFRTQLLKISDANPDGIYIVHTGALSAAVSNQTRELGIETQLLGQYGTESGQFISTGGKNVEGTIYSFPVDENDLTKKQINFIEEFTEIYGGKPQVAAYNAYDIYTLAIPIINECNREGNCINEKIFSISNFDGVGGKFSLKSGRLERELYFKKVENGEFVSIEYAPGK